MTAFFYCDVPYYPDLAYHDYISLAEGLTALGIRCYGDRDMYQPGIGQPFLIKHDEKFRPDDADIVFFHFLIYRAGEYRANQLIRKITHSRNRQFITVFIDADDGLITPGYKKGAQSCDIVLKSHYNHKYKYPSNFYPWQFGLTHRILNAVNPVSFDKKINSFLVNFRQRHQLRDYINNQIRPIVEKYMHWDNTIDNFTNEELNEEEILLWKQTGGRHYPNYYNKLSTSKACACYGGVFALPWGNHNKYTAKIARKINNIIQISQWDRVRQWDSWRLWETWAAGSCVIHIDFEKYGCRLPVMPENGIHYIGIDINNLPEFEQSFGKDTESIARNGREFVLKNYIPVETARRLLDLAHLKLS